MHSFVISGHKGNKHCNTTCLDARVKYDSGGWFSWYCYSKFCNSYRLLPIRIDDTVSLGKQLILPLEIVLIDLLEFWKSPMIRVQDIILNNLQRKERNSLCFLTLWKEWTSRSLVCIVAATTCYRFLSLEMSWIAYAWNWRVFEHLFPAFIIIGELSL